MRIRFVLGFVLLSGGAASAAPPAFTVEIERIVNSATPLPTDPSTFFEATDASTIVNRSAGLLFANASLGGGPPGRNGLFRATPVGIDTLALAHEAPFESGAGIDQDYVGSSGPVVFRARTPTSGISAKSIWMNDAGALSNLVPIGAELPDGAGPASDLQYPRINGSDVLFVGTDGAGLPRIYRTSTSGAPIETVIGVSPSPGNPDEGFDLGDFKDGRFVFRTLSLISDGTSGVYAGDLEGNTTEIVKYGDPVPGHEADEVFGRFGGGNTHPSMDNGRVAFVGLGSQGTRGVYTSSITGGTIDIVVDTTMELPNDNGATIGFGAPSISGDNIAFLGIAGNGRGIGAYVSMSGTIVDIIHKGDTLDGKIVDNVRGGSFGLNGNTLAFTITFEDFSRGLYLATVIPAPGSTLCLALGGAWAARRRRRPSDNA
jgi:hypothetical protein